MARILVVDDAVFMRTVLKKMIEEMGHEVAGEASNGLEAIAFVKSNYVDIVTLDITMPEMDGITAIPKILDVNPNIKIIMVSAMGQQNMVVDAIKAGAKEFIVKPFEKERVEIAFNKVL